MSVLHFAAAQTGTSFDSLVRGLTFFEIATVKAAQGSSQQLKAFQALGISQKDIAAGQRDILPLLGQAMDQFRGLSSGAERAAESAALLGRRSGPELNAFMRLGSETLKQFGERVKENGLLIDDFAVRKMKDYKAAVRIAEEEQKAFDLAIGQSMLGLHKWWSALVSGFYEAARASAAAKASWKDYEVFASGSRFIHNWIDGFHKVRDEIDALAKATKAVDLGKGLLPPKDGDAAAKALQNYQGLANILEQVRQKMAAAEGEEEKAASEMVHLAVEVAKARQEFEKLVAEGKLSAEDIAQQTKALNALPGAILQLWADLRAKLALKREEAAAKEREAQEAAGADLVKRIHEQADKTAAMREADWEDEIAKLRIQYAKKGQLTAENEKLLADLREAGLEKLHRAQVDAFGQELLTLQDSLTKQVMAQMMTTQRLDFQYDQDLAKYSDVEKQKVLATAHSAAEREAIEYMWRANQEAIAQKYLLDWQALQNSQGWQGVFGSKFATLIRGNEALSKEWASSTNQSLLMVKVAMESLGDTAQSAFGDLAQGMGSSIASAIVYKKSIKEAMESATASVLESVAAKAMVEAIYATAWGFMCLAEGNAEGAASAFTAAAIYGTVGGAAAIAGRAIAPSSGSSGGSGGSASSSAQASAASFDRAQSVVQPTQSGSVVHVNVYGHIFGINGVQQLASALNDAVLNRDVQLTATNTKTGVVVIK